MSFRHNLSFCACKTAWFTLEWQVYMGSSPHLCFSMQNSDFVIRLTSLYGSQISSVVLSTHNRVLSTRIKRLYGFQPSPVVLCMQNINFSTWITSLYGFQTSMQTSDFWTEIACLYGSQNSPVIFCMQNSVPSFRIASLYGSQPSSVVFACKTAILDPNNKSLWVPDITCRFVHAIQRD